MTKKAFVEELKGRGIDSAESLYDSFMEIIASQLKDGEEVTLNGIGKLKVVDRKARAGVNPKTGEKIKIDAKKAVTFKPAKNIKESLN